MDRQHHPRRSVTLALQMLQRKLRRRQPPALRAWTPQEWSRPGVGAIHGEFQTPSAAVLCVGLATAACMLLGDAILVPVTEVGSVACAIGWAATCAACLALARSSPERMRAVSRRAALGGVWISRRHRNGTDEAPPLYPGHFTAYEWIALGVWIAARSRVARRVQQSSKEHALNWTVGARKGSTFGRASIPQP